MRLRAGLVLSVVTCLGAGAPAAAANVYCAGDVPTYHGCTATTPTIQGALDSASSNPGPDTVLIPGGQHTLANGLIYSDHGQPDNGVRVSGGAECTKGSCQRVSLAGGSPGETLLSFTGAGAAGVSVDSLELEPGPGVTGLMVPPGGEASVRVYGADGSTGIRAVGTPGRPAVLRWASVKQPPGGATDIAIDAIGAALLEYPYLESDVGVRSRGTDGLLDISRATIMARTGITGRSARITRSLLDLRGQAGPATGLEAVCAGPAAPNADITATNVTLVAAGTPVSTGARAVARGGNGDSCDAVVHLNSTILHGVATSLDASGEAGFGADPRDGTARVEAAYSNFDPGAIHQSGPAQVETATPGENVYGDPRFNPRMPFQPPGLSWDSPLIDRGDPAPPEEPGLAVGRRDIGMTEYGFNSPFAHIFLESSDVIRPGRTVRLGAGASDSDYDPLHVRWQFSNGEVLEYDDVGQVPGPRFARSYPRPGNYVERVTVTDPTGRSASSETVVHVVRQRMLHLSLLHSRFRASRFPADRGRTVISYRTSVPESVFFRIERGVRRRHGRGLRWVRTRFRFREESTTVTNTREFNGWVDARKLRPGRYRLVAAPRGVRPLRARFRIVR